MHALKPRDKELTPKPALVTGRGTGSFSDFAREQPSVSRAAHARTRDGESFVDMRRAFGKIMSKKLAGRPPTECGHVALDCYMGDTGMYAAILANMVTLKVLCQTDMAQVKTVLDVSAGTGRVPYLLMQLLKETKPAIYANEVSHELYVKMTGRMHSMASKGLFSDHSDHVANESGSIMPVSVDLADPDLPVLEGPHVKLPKFDLIIWYGFQHVLGRGTVMRNTYDLLHGGGRLVMIDEYPGRDIPTRYGEGIDALPHRYVDMADDLSGWVTREWGEAMKASSRIGAIQTLKSMERIGDAHHEMRCLAFRKPTKAEMSAGTDGT